MSIYLEVLALLTEKKKLFSDFESITETMLFLQVDDLALSIEKRENLLQEIQGIDTKLHELCLHNQEINEALHHEGNANQLSPDAAKIYDMALNIKAIVNRVLKNEEPIRTHLDEEKQRLFDAMENLNKSGESVAGQYHQSVMTGLGGSVAPTANKFI
ncbi:hypothetical protein [Scatolibacter rhodanostii]|uniref:hypothetical protein n=1 Tax=Scatolibacter rhodanostii TaxID=2014781 RepID=UPI000C082207|nr:hypothetical protein [Scatolibacter rhodanostii]